MHVKRKDNCGEERPKYKHSFDGSKKLDATRHRNRTKIRFGVPSSTETRGTKIAEIFE